MANRIQARLSNATLRNFGLIMAAMVGLFFGLLLPKLFGKAMPTWPWMVSGVFLALSLIYPKALHHVYLLWMKVGLILGAINSRIILGLFFYIVVTPVALVRRLLGKDQIPKRFDSKLDSYRFSAEQNVRDPKTMEQPF